MSRNQVLELLSQAENIDIIQVGDLCHVSPEGNGQYILARVWRIETDVIIFVTPDNVYWVNRAIAEDFTFLADSYSQFAA